MEFIHFANEAISNTVKSHGIQVKDNYQGLGILAYPLTKISYKAPNRDYESEENNANLNLSVEQAWERIGGLGIRQNNEQVYGIVFKLNSEFWPIKVHIDVDSKISKKFAEEFNKVDGHFVTYNSGENFLNIVNNIKSNNYTLAAEFKAASEAGWIP